MPKYIYDCKRCESSHEFEMGINDERPTTCVDCGGELVRNYSGISMHTDNRDNPNSPKFWKRGKTVSQIADVVEGKANP